MLCFILSIYVFVLSTISCCSDDNCNDEIKTQQTSNHSQDQKDNCCNACSPFFACGSCSGFMFSNTEFSFLKIEVVQDKLGYVYDSNFIQDFVGKVWQPPKIS
jgi:hypothetical protein